MLLKNANLNQIIIGKTISVSPNTLLLDAREILLKHKIQRLVVLDSKKKPVGIITEKDIAKAVYNLQNKSIKSVSVSDFMSKNLITVPKTSTIYECAILMTKNKISSIIVLNQNNTLAGLVTKTDIASIFLTQSTSPLKISKIMTRRVITAMPSDSLLFVESLLVKYNISRVVIQRNRVPVGIITYRDFIPAKIPKWISQFADPVEIESFKKSRHQLESHVNQLDYLLPFVASDIMSSKPITVDSDEDVGVAVLLMIRNGISGLPVVKKSKLVGIITKSDIVKSISKK